MGHTTKDENFIHFGTITGPKAWPFFAWSDSTQDDEVVLLLQILAESRAVRLSDQSPIPDVVVLPKGYELVRSLAGDVQLDQAFVAMWFALRELIKGYKEHETSRWNEKFEG